MSDYLLTDDELKNFGHLSRQNPHKGTWNDMLLFLEFQIKEYAIEKHGSLENIQKEKEERKRRAKDRKIEKMKKRIKELKKKTFLKLPNQKHTHVFVNNGKQSSCECGMTIEEEEL